MQTCCFTGHRVIRENEQGQLLDKLDEMIIQAAERGVTVFRNGGALGFDTYAALSVLKLRAHFPEIKLFIDVPHRGQANQWRLYEMQRYKQILSLADKVTYVSEDYSSGCLFKRNRYMVDRSDLVIAYVRKTRGGSYYTVSYAEQLEKEIWYL